MSTSSKSLEIAFGIASQGQPPSSTGKASIPVAHRSAFQEGIAQIVQHGAISIGVYRLGEEFHAIRNYCPHQGAPLCRGTLHATHAPGEVGEFRPALAGRVLRCPWHGWEFDLVTGKGLYDARGRVKTYATRIDAEGMVHVEL